MGLEEMFERAVDLRDLPGRVEALEQRVAELEGSPPPDAVGPTLVTVNPDGTIEELGEELPIEAQGDLITGDEAGLPVILPVGEDGDVLTANSSAPEGIVWGSAPPDNYFTGVDEVVLGPEDTEIEFTHEPSAEIGAVVAIGVFFYANGGKHTGAATGPLVTYGGTGLSATTTGTLDGPVGHYIGRLGTPESGPQTVKIVKQGEASYDLIIGVFSFPAQLYSYELQQGSVVENAAAASTPRMTTINYNVASLVLAAIAVNGPPVPVGRALPLLQQGQVDRSGSLYGYEFNAGFLSAGQHKVSWQLTESKQYKCNAIGVGLLP